MAAPEHDGIVAKFINSSHPGEDVFGLDEFANCWAERVQEWNVVSNDSYANHGKTFHCSNPPSSSNGETRFHLHCKTCLDLGCSGSKLNKPSQRNYEENKFIPEQLDIFAHSSMNAREHDPNCPCVQPSNRSANRNTVVRQDKLFVEVKYKIRTAPPNDLIGFFEIRAPFDDIAANSTLSDLIYSKLEDLKNDGFISQIFSNGNPKIFKFKFIISKLPPISIVIDTIGINIGYNPIFHISLTKDQYWNNLRFWRFSGPDFLQQIPLYSKKPEQIILLPFEDEVFYIDDINNNRNQKSFIEVNDDKSPLGNSQNPHPISNSIYRFTELGLRKRISDYPDLVNDFGLEIIKKNLVKASLFKLNQNSVASHILILNNHTFNEATIRIRFFPPYRGITQSEINSDIQINSMVKGMSNSISHSLPKEKWPVIEPKSIDYIFLNVEGNGEFEVVQLADHNIITENEKILVQSSSGIITGKHSIDRVKMNFNINDPVQISDLLRHILSLSGMSGFDDWKWLG